MYYATGLLLRVKKKMSALRTENQMHIKVFYVPQNIDDKIQDFIQKKILFNHIFNVKHMLTKVSA